jgi:CheY-like chemotaxis protein
MKYTAPGRTIRVVVRPEGAQAILRVDDEGIGIAPEVLPRIFDLFVQGAQAPDRAEGGLGIGLTLVQMLTELHGGSVEAASKGLGTGATFTVRLPRAELPAPAEPARQSGSAIRRRVLIVEDNDDARDMLRTLLELQGHEVFEAADGAEGLRLAIQLHPDIALIDLGLPIIDGYEVARQIRRHAHQPRRLIAVTGYGQPEDRRRSLEAGFDEHVVKPVDPASMAHVLDAPI